MALGPAIRSLPELLKRLKADDIRELAAFLLAALLGYATEEALEVAEEENTMPQVCHPKRPAEIPPEVWKAWKAALFQYCIDCDAVNRGEYETSDPYLRELAYDKIIRALEK